MNPEYHISPPTPISFEVNDLMNTMKKCSFEDIGRGIKRRGGDNYQTKVQRLNRLKLDWTNIPDDQKRFLFPGSEQDYENLIEMFNFFEATKNDVEDKIFAASLILENDVLIRTWFEQYVDSSKHTERYFKQFKNAIVGTLNELFTVKFFEDFANILRLPLTDDEQKILNIDGPFNAAVNSIKWLFTGAQAEQANQAFDGALETIEKQLSEDPTLASVAYNVTTTA